MNLHFSCLPAWRGAAPVQHSIWAGDEVTGATTFRIVKEMDAGPAYGVMTERVRATDTAGDLLARLAEGGAGLLVATLDGIEDGSLEARPQQAEGDVATHPRSPSRTRTSTGTSRPPAWTAGSGPAPPRPAPGRRTPARGSSSDRSRPPTSGCAPGELRVGKAEVLVGTATTAVRLGEVKAFGARQMPAADWARGLRLAAEGGRLGPDDRVHGGRVAWSA